MNVIINSNLSRRDVIQYGKLDARIAWDGSVKHEIALAICWVRHSGLATVDGVAYDDAIKGQFDGDYRAIKNAFNQAIRAYFKLY